MTAPCFVLENVSKTYGRTPALVGTAGPVRIPWGVRVAVVGASGSGKSTLLNLLGLMDAPDPCPTTDIVYFREPGAGLSYLNRTGADRRPLGGDRDAVRGGDFGFVFQRHHLLPFLSARDNAGLGLMVAGATPGERREVATAWLDRFGIGSQAHQRPGELSGGQAQRAAVARALAHGPRVVFADEPTGNLDRDSAAAVLAALREWQRGGTPDRPRTLVLVTHDLRAAFEHCDRFLIVRDNRIEFDQLTGEPFTRTQVRERGGLFQMTADPVPASGQVPATAPPAPPPRRRVRWRDIVRLALTDLTVRGQRLASLTGLALLALATVLALVAVGFRNGQQDARARLDTTEARTVVATGYTDRVRLIDADTFERIRGLTFADGRKLCRDDPPNAFRWSHDARLFRVGAAPNGAVQEDNALGRSIAPDDPALARRGWAFDDPSGPEVIVSEGFLRDRCRLPTDAAFVWLDYENQAVRLRVVGRAAELPDAQHYILPDPFYQRLNGHQFKPRRTVSFVDLVFPTNSDADAAFGSVRDRAAEAELEAERPADSTRVRLRVPRGGRLPLPDLTRDAEELASAARLPARVEGPPLEPEKASPGGSECVTVYLDRVEDREEAARLLTDLGLKEAYTAQTRVVRAYNQTVTQLARLVLALAGVAAVCAVLNLLISTSLRVREKLPEIGILRACGLSCGHVRAVFAIEGIVLGGLAAATGWGVTRALLGPWIERMVAATSEDPAGPGLFRLDASDTGAVLAGTVLIAAVVCGWASGRAVHTHPAEAVR